MYITIVRFQLKPDVTLDAAKTMFSNYAGGYTQTAGLQSKHYIYSPGRGGAVYIWDSQDSAKKLFTDNWRSMMRSRYGSEPEIEWLANPVTLDNSKQ
ncbi:MAG: monooxygenase [Pseudomonadota bacterium]|jgi:hypothetical protein